MFEACEICGDKQWSPVYEGAVRDGAFGRFRQGATVARCGGCGCDRLAENCCLAEADYESPAYREHLLQELDTDSFLAAHDEMQLYPLQSLWPAPLRGLTVADIGCAGGSFIDHVRGLAKRVVAVEPCALYHDSLARRGCEVYPYADAAAREIGAAVDLAVSLQVIEHTLDPRSFLADVLQMLKPGGRLLISTPNRDDFLMSALPDGYPQFFYRVAHRWYFNAACLAALAERVGFTVEKTDHVHRYTLSNALLWLRDRRPSGRTEIPGFSGMGDDMWRVFLQNTGQSDCIYMVLRKGGGLTGKG